MKESKQTDRSKQQIPQELFETLFHNLPDAVFIHPFKEEGFYHFIEVNRVACERYGYTREKFLNLSPVDISAPSDVQKRAPRQAHEILARKGSLIFEAEHISKDGRRFPVEIHSITFDYQGQKAILSIARDISERKISEQQLKASEEKFHDLFENAPVAFFSVRDDGKIMRCNAAAMRLLGYSRKDEIIGKPVLSLYADTPSGKKEAKKVFKEFLAGKEIHNRELQMRKANGEIIWISLSVNSTLDEAGSRVSRSVVFDITKRKLIEQSLIESEERFRLAFYTSPDAITLSRLKDGVYVDVNEGFCKITGYTREEAVGKSALQLHIWGNPGDRTYLIEKLKKQGHITNYETRFHMKDGRVITGLMSAALIHLNGKPHILSISRDIEQIKQAEKALRVSEGRYRHLFEQAPIPLWEEDFSAVVTFLNKLFKDGVKRDTLRSYLENHPKALRKCARLLKVIDVNRATLDLYGAENKKELLGSLDTILTEKSLDAFREEILAIANGKDTFETEIQQKTLRGDLIDIYLRLSVRQGSGYRQVLVASTDITQVKRAEKEQKRLLARLRDQARRLQQILDTVPDGIFLMDTEHRIQAANPMARDFLSRLTDAPEGQVPSRLGNRPLSELLSAPPRGRWHEIIAGNRIFEALARPIGEPSSPQGWVMLLRDVTSQREVQNRLQQQERLAAVGQLAAGIAHDFNNILGVILLYAEMEQSTPGLPETTRKRLETILQQARRASNLVEQVLDFSRRSILERRPLDLVPLLKEEVKLMERTFPENINIQLHYGLGDHMVNADPTHLQQALLNLAVNARDAMVEKGGSLQFNLEKIHLAQPDELPLPDMAPGDWIRLTITDEGAGIPPEALPHIFEPFFTTKKPGEGTGLGLAQVYGIVKQHDGHIKVDSRPGAGATFIIYLPALALRTPGKKNTEDLDFPRGDRETILVVEDNLPLADVLKEILETLNYRVLLAFNGKEALKALEQHPEISLVLSDLVMPVMGGRELFQEMAEKTPHIKRIALSGYPLNQSGADLRSLGVADYLQKPPTIEKLGWSIARTLGKTG